MVESAQTDPNSANSKYQAELKNRDDKINQLKKEIDHLKEDRNDEMIRLNKKMELVMDEKDHQIKVNCGRKPKF